MKPDDDALLPIAEALTDGSPVEWEREEQRHPRLGKRISHLRLIGEIAEVYRSDELSGPAERPSPSGAETTADLDPLESPASWGPLRLLSRLGGGGFGEVYRAHDPALQRDVALKLIRADRDRDGVRFLAEARRLARVRHDNVVVVHGADRHEGRVGLWTDLLDGDTLEDRLRAHGTLGAEEATNVGIQLCRALAAVHAEGLIHQDVKTSNVMRERSGRIVLLDFGAVTERYGPGGDGADLRTGTPLFMAPERLRGAAATPASDLYSLGVVLYRLVSDASPVEAASLGELRRKHDRGETTPLRDRRPDLPAGFVQVVEQALAVDPDRRFRSAGEMERALAAWAVQPAPRPRFRRLALVAAAVALLLVAFAGWRWLFPPLSIDASLFRVRGGAEERLPPGAPLDPRDELFLEIRGNRSMHVLVLNQDAGGNAFVLFPLPDLDTRNPLAAGASHRLPGRKQGREQRWTMSVTGGRETFFVLASARPISHLDAALAAIARSRPGEPVPLDAGISSAILRGFGGLAAADPPGPAGAGPLTGLMEELDARASGARDVRAWRIDLGSPGP